MGKMGTITLTDDQMKTLQSIGVPLTGKEVSLSAVGGKAAFMRAKTDAMDEEIIICVSGC